MTTTMVSKLLRSAISFFLLLPSLVLGPLASYYGQTIGVHGQRDAARTSLTGASHARLQSSVRRRTWRLRQDPPGHRITHWAPLKMTPSSARAHPWRHPCPRSSSAAIAQPAAPTAAANQVFSPD